MPSAEDGAQTQRQRKEAIQRADVKLLAQLGYKQEFDRAFRPLEVRLEPRRVSVDLTFVPGLWRCVLHRRFGTFDRVRSRLLDS
jgi:hypothetical protein